MRLVLATACTPTPHVEAMGRDLFGIVGGSGGRGAEGASWREGNGHPTLAEVACLPVGLECRRAYTHTIHGVAGRFTARQTEALRRCLGGQLLYAEEDGKVTGLAHGMGSPSPNLRLIIQVFKAEHVDSEQSVGAVAVDLNDSDGDSVAVPTASGSEFSSDGAFQSDGRISQNDGGLLFFLIPVNAGGADSIPQERYKVLAGLGSAAEKARERLTWF